MLPIALGCACAPAAAADKRFSVTDFDRVQIEGPFEVTLATGLPSGALARGSPRALDRVDIDVQGRLLKIRRNVSAWGGYPGDQPGPVTIALTTRDLKSVFVRGAGSIVIDKAKGLKLDLSLSGNGRLAIDQLDADRVEVGLLGSGQIMLAGKVKSLKASVQGTGDLDAAKLKADDADISTATTGLVTLEVARAAKVAASGSGDIAIAGNAACTVQARGSGQVTCGKIR